MKEKYYWLKLKDDFFKHKNLKKLRNIAGGDTYTIIYLKMQLLSLKNEGKLIFDNLEETFAEELALELDEKLDNVKMTLAFLRQTNMIEEVDETQFILPETVNSIGGETSAAERMRLHRASKKGVTSLNLPEQKCNRVTKKCNPVTQRERKRKDIELEKDIDNTPISPLGEFVGIFSKDELAAIENWIEHKKERKEVYKPRGLKALITELINARTKGCSIIDAINRSMAKSWKGIYFENSYITAIPKPNNQQVLNNCNGDDTPRRSFNRG